MRFLKKLLVELLTSLGGIGTSSIGGLPGTPRSREEEKKTIWVDWGGSHLTIPELKRSQEAFKQGAYDQAYEHLGIAQESIKIETPTFKAQLLNNRAVSAYELSWQVDDVNRRQVLQNEAQDYITRAATKIETFPQELSDAIMHNLTRIGRKR